MREMERYKKGRIKSKRAKANPRRGKNKVCVFFPSLLGCVWLLMMMSFPFAEANILNSMFSCSEGHDVMMDVDGCACDFHQIEVSHIYKSNPTQNTPTRGAHPTTNKTYLQKL